jgi:hypothetical protein
MAAGLRRSTTIECTFGNNTTPQSVLRRMFPVSGLVKKIRPAKVLASAQEAGQRHDSLLVVVGVAYIISQVFI